MSRTIVIIGGGFSGLAVAIQLMKRTELGATSIIIVEPRAEVGRGLAYSAPSDQVKLNVPFSAMGALPDVPEDFQRWLEIHHPDALGERFASRNHYGAYLNDLFEGLLKSPGDVVVKRVKAEAIDLSLEERRARFRVVLSTDESIECDACVLAVGNLNRSLLNGISTDQITRSPYSQESYKGISQAREIALIGSGLTAVDVVIEAEERGFKGSYTMLSRHARLPLPHDAPSYAPKVAIDSRLSVASELCSRSLRSLCAWVRDEAEKLGSSQPVINAMRPHLQEVWQQMPAHDKKRFLRHLRSIWEVHRHRIPATHSELLTRLQSNNRLTLTRARISSVKALNSQFELTYTTKNRTTSRNFDAVFMCAGPEGDLTKTDSALIQRLLERGIIKAGELGLGVAPSSSTLSPQAQKRLKVIGPIQREYLWEITAVRELRVEALKVAGELTEALLTEALPTSAQS
jgi:uncharacterized NAD(P)/FAD-binding protein YdhS